MFSGTKLKGEGKLLFFGLASVDFGDISRDQFVACWRQWRRSWNLLWHQSKRAMFGAKSGKMATGK